MARQALKRCHLPRGTESLEVKCLRDGTLDVHLTNGKVLGLVRGAWQAKRLKHDRDGYVGFFLARERKQKRGKPEREVLRSGKVRLRYRVRRYVLVHRLVKIKAIAVAIGGKHWRQYVRDLPSGIDVNHIGARDENRHDMIELQTEAANRRRREMTPAEMAEVNACTF